MEFKHDRMQAGFTQVANAILMDSRLSMGARMTWAVLSHFAWQDEEAWAGQERMAAGMGVSERALRNYIRELEAAELITTEQRGRGQTNFYRLGSGPANSAVLEVTDFAGLDRQILPVLGEEDSVEEDEPLKPPSRSVSAECPEFGEWMGHHNQITGMSVMRAGTAARKKIAGMFRARQAEGYTLEQLKLATEGAFADEFRRERGYFDPESVLRPTKVAKLVDAGRRAQAAAVEAGERHDKWDRFEQANAEAQGRSVA